MNFRVVYNTLTLLFSLTYFDYKTGGIFSQAPIAATIMDFVTLGLVVLYTVKVDGYQGWDGFKWSAWEFRGLWEYLKLGIPSALMVCSEWWIFEFAAILAGKKIP